VREGMDRIVTEEWFVGYQESNEYRALGIGPAVGDLTQQMVEHARSDGKGDSAFKISLNGCHDTTIAATLAALGAFDATKDKWPNFTSNIAIELFKAKTPAAMPITPTTGAGYPPQSRTWFTSLTSIFSISSSSSDPAAPSARTDFKDLSQPDKNSFANYFVRLRYNDNPVTLPACKAEGKHWRDDESFCTFAAFKEAADSFTPKDWRKECMMGLGTPTMKEIAERPPGL
jgi:acid phosphatase